MAQRLAYLLEEFPRPTEAFILRELQALESHGAEVYVYAVRKPQRYELPPHALSRAVTYLPAVAQIAISPAFLLNAAQRHERIRGLLQRLRGAPHRVALLKELPRAAYISAEMRRRAITHLHAHFATRPANIALLASALYDVRFSFAAHAWDIFAYRPACAGTDFLREKIRAAAFVVTCTDEGKRHLEAIEPAGKIVMIHHGLDLGKFRYSPPLLITEPRTTLHLLSVARLVEKKGLGYLVEACAHLREQGERFFCRIVGQGDGERALRELILARDLEAHVQILPFCSQEELMRHYRQAHVVVLPSVVCADGDRDGIPNVLVEAMSLGVPVVSTRTAAIRELIGDGESGVLVEPRDARSLAEAIRYIARNPERAAQMAQRARRTIEERFDGAQTSRALVELFRTTCS